METKAIILSEVYKSNGKAEVITDVHVNVFNIFNEFAQNLEKVYSVHIRTEAYLLEVVNNFQTLHIVINPIFTIKDFVEELSTECSKRGIDLYMTPEVASYLNLGTTVYHGALKVTE